MKALYGFLIAVSLATCGEASLLAQDAEQNVEGNAIQGTGQGPGQQDASSELQRKADQATGADCTRLSMQAAHEAAEDAHRFFGAGDGKAAHNEIDRSLHYVRRAVDCSLQAGKNEKATEIDLRRLIGHMKEVLQALDTEERPQLSQSLTQLEEERDKLLRAIFGEAAGGRAAEKKP